jgi:predicted alpha/beta-fold hydrolase
VDAPSSLPLVPRSAVFAPAFGLRSAALQATLASKRPAKRSWRRHGIDLDAISVAHVLDCGDGVRLTGRFTPAPGSAPSRGLVVLIHGWEGHHDSSYLYSMAAQLHRAGYSTFRLNLRDHGGTHHLNEQMFHSARMDEVLDAVAAARALSTDGPLYVVGFSLGGNFALRVGLQGPRRGVRPRLVVGVSPSIDPGATLRGIDGGPALFRWYFLDKWRRTLEAKRRAWPHYDFSGFHGVRDFVEMTRRFVADFTEYASIEDYLAQYTLSPDMLVGSPTPLAIITSRDDSVIPVRDFEGLSTRGSVLACDLTDRGGHCGFIENWRFDSWAERRVIELLSRA